MQGKFAICLNAEMKFQHPEESLKKVADGVANPVRLELRTLQSSWHLTIGFV